MIGSSPIGAAPVAASTTGEPKMFTSSLLFAAAALMRDDGMTDAALKEQPPEYFDGIRKRLAEIAQTMILKPDMFRLDPEAITAPTPRSGA